VNRPGTHDAVDRSFYDAIINEILFYGHLKKKPFIQWRSSKHLSDYTTRSITFTSPSPIEKILRELQTGRLAAPSGSDYFDLVYL